MTVNIAKVQPQKRNKNRFNLYTEEGFLISLSYETLLKFHIREGGALEEEELEQVRAEDTVKYAKEQAMQYVAYAPRSQRQVEQQLAKKGVDARPVIDRIEQLDDRRKAIQQELDNCLSQQNQAAKMIGALMGQGKRDEAEAKKAEVAALKEKSVKLSARRARSESPRLK